MIDSAPLEALRVKEPKANRWRWSPGFHVGMVEAKLHLPRTLSRAGRLAALSSLEFRASMVLVVAALLSQVESDRYWRVSTAA